MTRTKKERFSVMKLLSEQELEAVAGGGDAPSKIQADEPVQAAHEIGHALDFYHGHTRP